VGITHFEQAPQWEASAGHLRGRWSALGEAAGSVGVGVHRIEVPAGAWATPAHDHAGAEELFYVLGGRGISWHEGVTAEIRAGDAIAYLAGGGAHTLHALEPLDVLAFGPRHRDGSTRFPRLGLTMIGRRYVESIAGEPRGPLLQFVREAEVGAPELPEPSEPRPANIVNLADVEAEPLEHSRVRSSWRDLGRATGSVTTGLAHVEVAPGMEATPLHCHSASEEIFVVLDGDGELVLDGAQPAAVRAGHVIARPPATRVAHMFRAGEGGLRFLAYGTREAGDLCYYPRSNKLAFSGVGVIVRVQPLDYWDGEG
jgi:uncharacterized cupin superfamily protein